MTEWYAHAFMIFGVLSFAYMLFQYVRIIVQRAISAQIEKSGIIKHWEHQSLHKQVTYISGNIAKWSDETDLLIRSLSDRISALEKRRR